MTAVDEDLSLDWVTFTAEPDAGPCDGLTGEPCSREAVVRATWEYRCLHAPGPTLHCASHRDRLFTGADPAADFMCGGCGTPIVLIRVEPIR
jgi:hypothetical protein